MGFVGLENIFDCVPWGILWGYCGSMGYRGSCYKSSGPVGLGLGNLNRGKLSRRAQ